MIVTEIALKIEFELSDGQRIGLFEGISASDWNLPYDEFARRYLTEQVKHSWLWLQEELNER